MPTPADITGIGYYSSKKLVACLYFPTGLSAGAGTIVTGGTVTGSTTIATGATAIFLGLTETVTGSGEYGVKAVLTGTSLPDTTNEPYTRRVLSVDPATNMGSYTAIAAAYATAFSIPGTVADTEEPVRAGGGYLRAGAWGAITPAAGSPSVPCTITVTMGSGPVAGANVWIKQGASVVAGVMVSDSLGQVHTLLIPGVTYQLFATATGENPINGQTFVAVAD